MTRVLEDLCHYLAPPLSRAQKFARSWLVIVACVLLMGPPAASSAALPPPSATRLIPGFAEPLYATGRVGPQETQALEQAVAAFQRPPPELPDVVDLLKPLEAFVREYPDSAWRTALDLNLGLAYARSGYSSRAIGAFRSAWLHGRNAQQSGVTEQVDRAVAELASLLSRLGRVEELTDVLAQVGNRPMAGPATELMTTAREADWMFRNEPGAAFLCGPLALRNLLSALHADISTLRSLDGIRAGPNGTTLAQLSHLANEAGLAHQLIRRRKGEPIPVPSVAHWKLDHFAAIVEADEGRFHVMDPSLGTGGAWISAGAIEEESSGFFLVPARASSTNWRLATASEADVVKGRGKTLDNDDGSTRLEDATIHPVCQSHGMCVANAKEMLTSLHLTDTPVGYVPPIGPSAMVQMVYNQREARRSAVPAFFSVGQKWTMNFQSWVEDDPNATGNGPIVQFPPGGGYVDYQSFPAPVTFPDFLQFSPDKWGGMLRRFPARGPATSYEYRTPSGQRLVYSYSDGATVLTRRIFLTDIIDPDGTALKLEYAIEGTSTNRLLRLKRVRDASGGDTTFEYFPDKLWITKITDPFGRFATLSYDGLGYLNSITDAINLTSSFTYKVRSEQRIEDTSPYDASPNPYPYGEYGSASGTGGGETSGGVVIEAPPFPSDKPCSALSADERRRRCDYGLIDSMTTPYGTSYFSSGQDLVENYRFLVIRFLALGDPDGTVEVVQFRHKVKTIASEEPASQVPVGVAVYNGYLEYRNSFYWDKQSSSSIDQGIGALDYRQARITHWLHTRDRKTSGIAESRKLPLESRVWYLYDGQRTPYEEGTSGLPSTIARRLSDVPLGNGTTQPVTYKIGLSYNTSGRLLKTVETLQGLPDRTTEYIRDANGLDLLSIGRRETAGAPLIELRGFSYYPDRRLKQNRYANGNKVDYTYDTRGRVKTITAGSGRTHIYTYEPERPYDVKRIDVEGTQLWKSYDYDARGRVSGLTRSGGYSLAYGYDDLDRLTTITYPDNSTQQFIYDRLDLHQIISRNGHVRTYLHDGNRRVRKYDDGKSVTSLTYHKGGALKSFTMDGSKTTSWDVDLRGRPIAKTYVDGSQEIYAYDKNVSVLAEWTNVAGDQSSYRYYPDNKLKSVLRSQRGAPPIETVYEYSDPYFSQLTSIKQATQVIDLEYYLPGLEGAHQLRQERINGQAHGPLYTYDSIGRIASSTLDQTIAYGYDAIGRLKTYQGLRNFEVTYYPDTGRINSISSDLLSSEYSYYDNLRDQRVSVISNRPGREYAYEYDGSGNIKHITERHSGSTTTAEWGFGYDETDRLTSGGKVQGQQTFDYDGSGNLITLRGQPAAYNGLNQITFLGPKLPERRYRYDTLNRLVEIRYPGSSDKYTRITYDAIGRIATIFDVSGLPIRLPDGRFGQALGVTRELTWCGMSVCKEQFHVGDGFGGPRIGGSRLYFYEGHHETNGGDTFYRRDHLGSVRETVSPAGTTVAAFDFDAYGKSLSGAAPPKGFAGMFFHEPSGLYFALNRAYDPESARWLTRDPIAERGGLNLYAYANGNPVSYTDRSGLYLGPPPVLLLPPPPILAVAAPLVLAGLGGIAIGTAINYFAEDWIQAKLDQIFAEPETDPVPVFEPTPRGRPFDRPSRLSPAGENCDAYGDLITEMCFGEVPECLALRRICEDACIEGSELPSYCPSIPPMPIPSGRPRKGHDFCP